MSWWDDFKATPFAQAFAWTSGPSAEERQAETTNRLKQFADNRQIVYEAAVAKRATVSTEKAAYDLADAEFKEILLNRPDISTDSQVYKDAQKKMMEAKTVYMAGTYAQVTTPNLAPSSNKTGIMTVSG